MKLLQKLKPFDRKTGRLNVVIDTPKGCRNKYAFDLDLKGYVLKAVMPKGMMRPSDRERASQHRNHAALRQSIGWAHTGCTSGSVIMRTFVQLRRLMDSNADLARKIESLEKKYDEKFAVVFAAIKQLITPAEPRKPRIGFKP